jgi:hypothetical protein
MKTYWAWRSFHAFLIPALDVRGQRLPDLITSFKEDPNFSLLNLALKKILLMVVAGITLSSFSFLESNLHSPKLRLAKTHDALRRDTRVYPKVSGLSP